MLRVVQLTKPTTERLPPVAQFGEPALGALAGKPATVQVAVVALAIFTVKARWT